MPNPNWEQIREEWETSKVTLKALAEKHDVKLGTLKSRKSREKWSRDATKKDATKNKKVATTKPKVATKKKNKKVNEEPVIENDELTDKQRLFCIYYIKYFNATKAYQKAYEVDYATAQSIAYRLMGKDGIKQEIQRLKQQRLNEAYFDKYDVLQKYKDIAFADITDFVEFGREEVEDELGNTYEVNKVKFRESSEVDGTIITEIKQGKDGVSVKLADKMKALDFLAKYTDLLSENDKKRLQEEKLKAETEKAKAEAERIAKESSDDDVEEIVIVDEWSVDDD